MQERKSKLLKVLNRPVYSNTSPQFRILQAFIFGVFVTIFLIVFEPFQISGYGPYWRWFAAGFGVVTTITMMVLNVLIPPLFFPFFEPENWTLWKEILYNLINIISIGAANSAFFLYTVTDTFSWGIYFRFQFYTFCVGLLPVIIIVLLKERRDFSKYHKESQYLNSALIKRTFHPDVEVNQITIPSKNKNEDLQIDPSNLLFIRAMDNYLEVYTTLEKFIIRNTLKEVEVSVANEKRFLRCHKSYLVNLDQVIEISGNAQGYKLLLNVTDQLIPVSRKLNDTIRSKFLQ